MDEAKRDAAIRDQVEELRQQELDAQWVRRFRLTWETVCEWAQMAARPIVTGAAVAVAGAWIAWLVGLLKIVGRP